MGARRHLTRRTRHLLAPVDSLFLFRGIELHSVSESLETSTAHGRFVLTLFGGLAPMERELTGDRTRGALGWMREQVQPTSHPPLGFKPNGKRHHMVLVPEELVVVQRILALWRCGRSARAIAGILDSECVPTKHSAR
jgi:DNA invertase Pin-like site-specific DNA recombinase